MKMDSHKKWIVGLTIAAIGNFFGFLEARFGVFTTHRFTIEQGALLEKKVKEIKDEMSNIEDRAIAEQVQRSREHANMSKDIKDTVRDFCKCKR